MNNSNIISLFLTAAERNPHTIAFIHDKEEVTYQQLEKSVKRAAEELRKEGITAGDRVLIFIPMSIPLYKTVLSLFYIGAIPVFIDQWAGLGRLNSCLKMVSCQAVIAPRKILLLGWLVSSFRFIKLKLTPPESVFPHLVSLPAQKSETDTALITFTTGSTGQPKAADRTHGFLHAQHEALRPLVYGNYQRSLTLLPIVVLLNLAAGKTTLLPSRHTPKKGRPCYESLYKLIVEKKADAIIGSPSILAGISGIADSLPLAHVVTGGGPLFPAEAQSIARTLSPAFGMAVYGSTEAEPISTIAIADLAATTLETVISSGLPVGEIHPDVELAIIPFGFEESITTVEGLNSIQQPKGSAGEIAVKGKHVLTSGYVDNVEAWTKTKIVAGGDVWHRTGDAGRVDASGKLYFLGRCTERIQLGKEVVFPVIISYLLKVKAGVKDAAILENNDNLVVVIEKSDRDKEEKVKVVLAESGHRSFAVAYVKAIPKDPRHHTKTDYMKLRKMLTR